MRLSYDERLETVLDVQTSHNFAACCIPPRAVRACTLFWRVTSGLCPASWLGSAGRQVVCLGHVHLECRVNVDLGVVWWGGEKGWSELVVSLACVGRSRCCCCSARALSAKPWKRSILPDLCAKLRCFVGLMWIWFDHDVQRNQTSFLVEVEGHGSWSVGFRLKLWDVLYYCEDLGSCDDRTSSLSWNLCRKTFLWDGLWRFGLCRKTSWMGILLIVS